ncbi:MAG: response regulator [Anaerolineae bacterium]
MSNPMNVLIVDGDAHNLMTLSALLKTLGVRYKRNTTGNNVVQQALSMLPKLDAILLDLNLPDADAFAICRELKSEPLLAKIPVIAMAHEHKDDLVQRARHNGFAGFVARPFPRIQFEQYLRRIILGERMAGNGKH